MSQRNLVELPVIQWLSGHPSGTDNGLGWTYRDETAMAAFDRPLEDPLVERLLVAAILRINSHVKTDAQAKLAIAALRKTMSHPDKLTANRQTLDLLRDGAKVALNPGEDAKDFVQRQKSRWKELARDPKRIEIVLEKMLKHFLEHPDPNGFKAQLVAARDKGGLDSVPATATMAPFK